MFTSFEGNLSWKSVKAYRKAKAILRPWIDKEGYFIDGPGGQRIYPENAPAFDDTNRTLRIDGVMLEYLDRAYPDICTGAKGKLVMTCTDCGSFCGTAWIDGQEINEPDLGAWAEKQGMAGWSGGYCSMSDDEDEEDCEEFDECSAWQSEVEAAFVKFAIAIDND